jgi:hypothetical protein
VGAAAALAGLVFVAVSINLARILMFATLPRRAVETLAIAIGLLLASVLVLVPGQSPVVFGTEILVLGAAMAVAPHRPGRKVAGRRSAWSAGVVVVRAAGPLGDGDPAAGERGQPAVGLRAGQAARTRDPVRDARQCAQRRPAGDRSPLRGGGVGPHR